MIPDRSVPGVGQVGMRALNYFSRSSDSIDVDVAGCGDVAWQRDAMLNTGSRLDLIQPCQGF